METAQKVYSEDMFIFEDKGEQASPFRSEYDSLMSMVDMFGTTEDFKVAYKEFCGRVRAALGVNTMVSFSPAVGRDETGEELTGLMVFTYPVPYTSALQCQTGMDEGGFYLLVEGEVSQ